jgi:hypothetical protein
MAYGHRPKKKKILNGLSPRSFEPTNQVPDESYGVTMAYAMRRYLGSEMHI